MRTATEAARWGLSEQAGRSMGIPVFPSIHSSSSVVTFLACKNTLYVFPFLFLLVGFCFTPLFVCVGLFFVVFLNGLLCRLQFFFFQAHGSTWSGSSATVLFYGEPRGQR